jgi:hypothetical protein
MNVETHAAFVSSGRPSKSLPGFAASWPAIAAWSPPPKDLSQDADQQQPLPAPPSVRWPRVFPGL